MNFIRACKPLLTRPSFMNNTSIVKVSTYPSLKEVDYSASNFYQATKINEWGGHWYKMNWICNKSSTLWCSWNLSLHIFQHPPKDSGPLASMWFQTLVSYRLFITVSCMQLWALFKKRSWVMWQFCDVLSSWQSAQNVMSSMLLFNWACDWSNLQKSLQRAQNHCYSNLPLRLTNLSQSSCSTMSTFATCWQMLSESTTFFTCDLNISILNAADCKRKIYW